MNEDSSASIEQGRDLAFCLYEEADHALRSWAIVEAQWLAREPWRSGSTRLQIRHPGLGEALRDVGVAALRDALMCLGRMTDAKTGVRRTLFAIPSLTTDEAVEALRNDHPGRDFERAVALIGSDFWRWDENMRAKTWREAEKECLWERPVGLMKCRAELDRFRNSMLAHSTDRGELGGLHLDRYRTMMVCCVTGVRAALRVFRGTTWPAKRCYRQYLANQCALYQSTSVDYLHTSAGPFVQRIWEDKRCRRRL